MLPVPPLAGHAAIVLLGWGGSQRAAGMPEALAGVAAIVRLGGAGVKREVANSGFNNVRFVSPWVFTPQRTPGYKRSEESRPM